MNTNQGKSPGVQSPETGRFQISAIVRSGSSVGGVLIIILFLLVAPARLQAQFAYTTNNGALTIKTYTGAGGAVTIPSSTNGLPVTGIAMFAFSLVETMTSVTIPASVTNFGQVTFNNCTNLTGIYFQGDSPPNFNAAGGLVIFSGNNNATVYYLPGKNGWRTTFDQLPAVQWDPQVLGQLQYHTNINAISINGYTGSGGAVVIPSTINGWPVTGLDSNAFFNCTSLTGVTLPNTITNVGNAAFAGCTALTNIALPGGIAGSGVFSNCTALTTVSIPSRIGSLSSTEFSLCTALVSLIIPGTITNLGNGVFQNCTALKGVYFQGNAPVADASVFTGDNFVTNYYFPATSGWGSTLAGRPAVPIFFNCTTNAGTVTITKYNGTDSALIIPAVLNGFPVVGLGFNAFEGATVTSAIIPNSVTNIGVQAFSDCYSLTNVVIGTNVISIGNRAFENCSSLRSVTIPDSVTLIQEATFVECTSLTSAVIGKGVTSIQDLTFDYCFSLQSVTVGGSLTSIGSYAFYDCTNLTGIYFQGNAPSISSDIFDYDTNATAYYAPGTTGWGATFDGLPSMPWILQMQSHDAGFGVRTNQFGFNISPASGAVVVVEACTNLMQPVWLPVATNSVASGSTYFSDPQWLQYPNRYYRLRTP